MVKTPCFHCRGRGFDPWSRNADLPWCTEWAKKKKSGKTISAYYHWKWYKPQARRNAEQEITVAVFNLIPRLKKLYSAQEYTNLINRQLCLFFGGIVVKTPFANAGSQVQFLIWENSTWCRKTKPLHPRACALQREKPLQGKALALQGRVAPTRHN